MRRRAFEGAFGGRRTAGTPRADGASGAATWAVALALCAAASALGAPLAAQSRVSTGVDSTHVTVGDRIAMMVTVEHPPSARVTWPDSLDLAPFEVLEVRLQPDEAGSDVVRSTAVLTLAAFELGELEIPSFDLVVTAADGAEELLSTDRFGIEVASVGADESGDIRDIRGPMGIPLGALRLALWVLLPLLLAAALWVVARRLRAKPGDAAQPALLVPPRPAHEVALDALAALEASPMLDRGLVKEYHIEASDILRTYVEARFGVQALEMTTLEVLAGLHAAGTDARFSDGLRAFLYQCDLVKFAKVRPGPDVSRHVLDLGRRIVLDSAPSPQSAATGSEGGPEAGLAAASPPAAVGEL